MPGSHHIIQKQILEVETSGAPDAFAFRNRLSEIFHDRIFPQLENIFDEVCPPGYLIAEDRLEIDIGNIDERRWEEELVEKTVREIKNK